MPAPPVGADLLLLEVNTNHVLRFDETTAAPKGIFAMPDVWNGNAADMAVGPDGNLYFTDYQGDRILRHDGTTGTFLDVFADTGRDGL